MRTDKDIMGINEYKLVSTIQGTEFFNKQNKFSFTRLQFIVNQSIDF